MIWYWNLVNNLESHTRNGTQTQPHVCLLWIIANQRLLYIHTPDYSKGSLTLLTDITVTRSSNFDMNKSKSVQYVIHKQQSRSLFVCVCGGGRGQLSPPPWNMTRDAQQWHDPHSDHQGHRLRLLYFFPPSKNPQVNALSSTSQVQVNEIRTYITSLHFDSQAEYKILN